MDKHKSSSPLPLLSRLDRLDHLMEFLEENQCLSWRQHGSSSSDHEERQMADHCCNKTLSLALEEVHDKGSLMDRLAKLENRVLQLSLAMDAAKTTSRSSSSSPDEVQDGSFSTTVEEVCLTTTNCREKREKRSGLTMKYRKWFGWFPMGC